MLERRLAPMSPPPQPKRRQNRRRARILLFTAKMPFAMKCVYTNNVFTSSGWSWIYGTLEFSAYFIHVSILLSHYFFLTSIHTRTRTRTHTHTRTHTCTSTHTHTHTHTSRKGRVLQAGRRWRLAIVVRKEWNLTTTCLNITSSKPREAARVWFCVTKAGIVEIDNEIISWQEECRPEREARLLKEHFLQRRLWTFRRPSRFPQTRNSATLASLTRPVNIKGSGGYISRRQRLNNSRRIVHIQHK